jgi:hypothetical protein
MRTYQLFILFACLFTTNFCAAIQKDTDNKAEQIRKKFQEELKSGAATKWDSLNLAHSQQLLDEQFKTMLAQERDNQRAIEDNNYAMHHRWRSFDFQYEASIIIFILVIVIVLTGIVFSGIQFRYTLKHLNLKEKILDAAKQADEAKQPDAVTPGAIDLLKTDLAIGKDGIKVNSSVLGVIILVISIAFFYLYLIYVYPINYIASGDAIAPTKTDTLPKAAMVKQVKTEKPQKKEVH